MENEIKVDPDMMLLMLLTSQEGKKFLKAVSWNRKWCEKRIAEGIKPQDHPNFLRLCAKFEANVMVPLRAKERRLMKRYGEHLEISNENPV